MEIVYLANSQLPSKGASTIQIVNMCSAFKGDGHQVTLVVPHHSGPQPTQKEIFEFYNPKNQFTIRTIQTPIKGSLGKAIFSFKAGNLAANMDADLVYGRDVIGCHIASLFGMSTAFESHGPYTNRRFGRIREYILRRLTTHTNFLGLFVISNWLKDYYSDECPYLDNIVVVPDAAEQVKDHIDPKILGGDSKFKVGYIGSLYPGRGVNIILELSKNCNWADFHLIGGDEETVRHWKAQTANVDNIHFHGFVPPGELDSYRIAFDVLLAPYQQNLETISGTNTVNWMSPLKIFEYMASGTAIISSDLPALREILDESNAILCEPDDITKWIDALTQLHTNEEYREQLGRNAKQEFEQNYTWEKRAERIIENIKID